MNHPESSRINPVRWDYTQSAVFLLGVIKHLPAAHPASSPAQKPQVNSPDHFPLAWGYIFLYYKLKKNIFSKKNIFLILVAGFKVKIDDLHR